MTKLVLFYNSITEIPTETWDELNCASNLYFSPSYLISIEKNNPQISFFYLVLIDDTLKPIAFSYVQIIDFKIKKHPIAANNELEKTKSFLRKILFPEEKPFKILVCGNTFVSGEHGVFIKPGHDEKKAIKALTKGILYEVNSNRKLNKDIRLFLLKDFMNESLSFTNELKELNYSSFNVEPNMTMNIQGKWLHFDDYLASMKTKFRVKARKALKQSSEIYVKEVSLKNIERQLPNMTLLYQKVAEKASFNFGDFNLETYRTLKENLGEKYILKTYWLDDKMVGFISGILNEKSLDAHFVGIDYALNREYAIYQKMLYDYISIGIKNKVKIINFGRTASEIKSSVGAIPKALTIYIRHKRTLKNKLLKLFLQQIAPTPFNQKHPFKTSQKDENS
jgi:hypothetical protein